jgi:hypothetical protein
MLAGRPPPDWLTKIRQKGIKHARQRFIGPHHQEICAQHARVWNVDIRCDARRYSGTPPNVPQKISFGLGSGAMSSCHI